jgi:hypothetical protein
MFTVKMGADFYSDGMLPCNQTDLLTGDSVNSYTGGVRFESRPRAGLDAVEKRKILHCRKSNPGSPEREIKEKEKKKESERLKLDERTDDLLILSLYNNAVKIKQIL